ncbi:MAG: hypothetical protein Q9218_005915 [Villophora microphyllina]
MLIGAGSPLLASDEGGSIAIALAQQSVSPKAHLSNLVASGREGKKRGSKTSPLVAKPKGTAKGKRVHEDDAVENDVSEDQGNKLKKVKGGPTDDDDKSKGET